MVDALLGTFLNWLLLNQLNKNLKKCGYNELVSGNYYSYEKYIDEGFMTQEIDFWKELKWQEDGSNFISKLFNKSQNIK